ncbi:mandelate racemase/muconate lactonizing enzyme family protein [uncultured Polaribacter sp.]|uniref:mandelate racemase/muconate lactonizing enzyme family protein n=1 Tax=uncultured Polaribacter sp. TaxID=174711 RepID=UPI002634485D|nr:mandelate racemase/muconate lactonizing enzyme family protein [uncultured Polaribacter sp.]
MKTNRRQFIKSMSALGVMGVSYPLLSACGTKNGNEYLNEKITKIEIFRYDINIPRYFSWGTWHNRQHLFIKISSGNFYGWTETPASKNNPDFKPTAWVNYLKQFKGLTIGEAQKILASEQVLGSKRSLKMLESLDMALLDLSGRLQNKSAVELLGLRGTKSVPGLYCILDKDEKKVREEAEKSIEQNLAHHLKFKMYGDEKVDMKLLKTIRGVLGDEAVVISDVNKGYKKWKSLDQLKGILNRLSANGLNAIEDPANLKTKQWIQLQEMVGDLTLIPDAPMRPAWKGIKTMQKGMGHIYNLHPSTMGSLTHTAKLAHKVKEIGAKVMIGDDSLVGPACSAWQQIAIGVGATWVEAIEKKEDSKLYLECLQSTATKKDANGYYSYQPKPGFGVELDTNRLKKVSALYIEV